MVRSNSVPDSTLGRPWACTAQLDLGHSPRPAMAPPAASPCTKRRRDGLSSPSTARPKESNDMDNSGKRQKTRLGASGKGLAQSRSEEHTSELQSLMRISYAVFCLKKKKKNKRENT